MGVICDLGHFYEIFFKAIIWKKHLCEKEFDCLQIYLSLNKMNGMKIRVEQPTSTESGLGLSVTFGRSGAWDNNEQSIKFLVAITASFIERQALRSPSVVSNCSYSRAALQHSSTAASSSAALQH